MARSRTLRRLLRVRKIRMAVGRWRLWWFRKIKRRWKAVDSEDAFDVTVEHNAKQLAHFGNERMRLLVRPLSVIETLDRHAKILVIGPRNEYDLLMLWGYGFEHVTGLDLFSYSPHIDVGDMHALPYEDDHFDAALCGWTLSYSRTPDKAAAELLRVTRPGGVIGVAVEYATMTYDDAVADMGYSIADEGFERLNSVAALRGLFGEGVGEVFFSHDAPARRAHTRERREKRPSGIALLFAVREPS